MYPYYKRIMRLQYIYTHTTIVHTNTTNHHHHISEKRRRSGSNERSRNGGELAHSSGPLLRPQRNDRRHFPPIQALSATAEKRPPLARPSPLVPRASQVVQPVRLPPPAARAGGA